MKGSCDSGYADTKFKMSRVWREYTKKKKKKKISPICVICIFGFKIELVTSMSTKKRKHVNIAAGSFVLFFFY